VRDDGRESAESTTTRSDFRSTTSGVWADVRSNRALDDGSMTPQMRSGAGAVGSAIVLGLVLGFWCRVDSATSGVEGALADLGAPWIVTAFVAGAVTTAAGASTVDQGAARRSVVRVAPVAALGAASGAACLMLATFVYYGPARTGAMSVAGAVTPTIVWSVAGVAVGAVFGVAGAIWRATTSTSLSTAALVLVGTSIAAEAMWHLSQRTYGDEPRTAAMLASLAAIGVALPCLAGDARRAGTGMALVALLAVPGAAVVETVSLSTNGVVSAIRQR